MAPDSGVIVVPSAVVVFTSAYPYGRGEEFLDGELPYLLAEFSRVIIVPTLQLRGQSPTRQVPNGVEVVAPESVERRGILEVARLGVRHPLIAAHLFVRTIRGAADLAALRDDVQLDLLSTWVALRIRRRLGALLEEVPEVVFYGFWLGAPARVALEARRLLRRPGSPAVTRANGFDLFAERSPRGYLPQRSLILGSVDRVFAASEPAEEYLHEHYPEYSEKYSVARIGTTAPIGPGNSQRLPVHVVSCCYISAVKRVPMLIDGLAELQRRGVELRWSHIGSGADDYVAQVVEYARENLEPGTVEFLGHMESDDVRRWYAANPATFFAQMSESEGGLAASIQEALAQGLPTVVTSVGGVTVLADAEQPIFDGLLEVDHTPQEFADRVQLLLAADDATYRSYSAAAMEYWQKNCSVDVLSSRFASSLRDLARRQ
jgi:colanic acid/amylovoran biosynthesis glycosyltransferase